jgi:hypothetical protein
MFGDREYCIWNKYTNVVAALILKILEDPYGCYIYAVGNICRWNSNILNAIVNVSLNRYVMIFMNVVFYMHMLEN